MMDAEGFGGEKPQRPVYEPLSAEQIAARQRAERAESRASKVEYEVAQIFNKELGEALRGQKAQLEQVQLIQDNINLTKYNMDRMVENGRRGFDFSQEAYKALGVQLGQYEAQLGNNTADAEKKKLDDMASSFRTRWDSSLRSGVESEVERRLTEEEDAKARAAEQERAAAAERKRVAEQERAAAAERKRVAEQERAAAAEQERAAAAEHERVAEQGRAATQERRSKQLKLAILAAVIAVVVIAVICVVYLVALRRAPATKGGFVRGTAGRSPPRPSGADYGMGSVGRTHH
jgi:hypothetical protein